MKRKFLPYVAIMLLFIVAIVVVQQVYIDYLKGQVKQLEANKNNAVDEKNKLPSPTKRQHKLISKTL